MVLLVKSRFTSPLGSPLSICSLSPQHPVVVSGSAIDMGLQSQAFRVHIEWRLMIAAGEERSQEEASEASKILARPSSSPG
jgi:hypothetical protein